MRRWYQISFRWNDFEKIRHLRQTFKNWFSSPPSYRSRFFSRKWCYLLVFVRSKYPEDVDFIEGKIWWRKVYMYIPWKLQELNFRWDEKFAIECGINSILSSHSCMVLNHCWAKVKRRNYTRRISCICRLTKVLFFAYHEWMTQNEYCLSSSKRLFWSHLIRNTLFILMH